jgi:hypothetical protein
MFHVSIRNTAAEVAGSCPLGVEFAVPQYAGNCRKVMHQ